MGDHAIGGGLSTRRHGTIYRDQLSLIDSAKYMALQPLCRTPIALVYGPISPLEDSL